MHLVWERCLAVDMGCELLGRTPGWGTKGLVEGDAKAGGEQESQGK